MSPNSKISILKGTASWNNTAVASAVKKLSADERLLEIAAVVESFKANP